MPLTKERHQSVGGSMPSYAVHENPAILQACLCDGCPKPVDHYDLLLRHGHPCSPSVLGTGYARLQEVAPSQNELSHCHISPGLQVPSQKVFGVGSGPDTF